MKAKLTFLGTGTSQGIPIIGCHCAVCRSEDARDKRFRASAVVEYAGLTILVDAGPDFRMQMLSRDICHLDAILLTHNHKDHTGGLDDVRSLNYTDRHAVDIYCEEPVLVSLRREYGYAFEEHKYPGAPEWHVHTIGADPFLVRSSRMEGDLIWVHDKGYYQQMPDGSLRESDSSIKPAEAAPEGTFSREGCARIIPIRGYHDKLPVLGFRFGDIAYITDMSSIPESEFGKLKGLSHLTLNTVGYKPHHSHFSLDEALALADRIGAAHTWLTHLSHSFPTHEAFCRDLEGMRKEKGIRSVVFPAYDGLVIED